jgi:hypothetical protein
VTPEQQETLDQALKRWLTAEQLRAKKERLIALAVHTGVRRTRERYAIPPATGRPPSGL